MRQAQYCCVLSHEHTRSGSVYLQAIYLQNAVHVQYEFYITFNKEDSLDLSVDTFKRFWAILFHEVTHLYFYSNKNFGSLFKM